MALELSYLNTFIDVKDDFEDMAGSRSRAQSSPPCNGRRISFSFFSLPSRSEEQSMRSYVSSLSQKMTDGFTWLQEDAETPTNDFPALNTDRGSDSPESPADSPAQREVLLSQGSLGHPEVCRRPCIFRALGECEKGNACAYCHMDHFGKTPKLDKRQRTIVQGLNQSQLCRIILRFCSSKAEKEGFLDEAAEVLAILAEESAGVQPLQSLPLSDRDLRNVSKTLSRMSFSNLIGLATRQSANSAWNDASADRLNVPGLRFSLKV